MWQFPQTGNSPQSGFGHAGSTQQQFPIPGMNMQALANYPPDLLRALQSNGGLMAGTNQLMPPFGQGFAGAVASSTQQDSSEQTGFKGAVKKKEEKAGKGQNGESNSRSSTPNQQNQNLQLAAMAAVNPQLLQYLHAQQPFGLFGSPGMLGGMNLGSDQGGFNIQAQQALMFAKQQQLNAQMALQANSKDSKGKGESDLANQNPLAFAAGQPGMFNPGFGAFNLGQGPAGLSHFGGGLMNAGGTGLGVMSPDLLAMLNASNNSLDASQGKVSNSAGLNGLSSQKEATESKPPPKDAKSEKKKYTSKSESKKPSSKASTQQTSALVPNPSAMDVPSQSAAALIGEENKKVEKARQNSPGYVSGPSKSKVGTTPQELPPLLKGKFVTKAPNCHDILCGRGNFVNNHVGNKNFREIVALHKVLYVAAPKHSKPMFARKIIDAVHALDPPGRFLAQEPSTKLWYEMDNKKAMSKTRQALREGAPQIMKTIQVETSGNKKGGHDV